ncbi:NADPH-dependent FMN reductase [Actinomadura alba]|uniref:NAD(P)H-dependent oxidoreductase n=1 Tax=Actinomadura alba TaxID=406431 RepID=A0ABR7LMQ9_9ACTN|nr:NAD(P)H-dependent oxidoreductase [Actinomadura alba]MBC6466129.1 NAD(P)H-dependent oxidoreductase [Actinomadura alba]
MPGEPLQLAVLIGSTREGRFGPTVADWFIGQVEQRGDLKVDRIDLLGTEIPGMDFTTRVGLADAFVVVTPEYNRGYPGELKCAVDSVKEQWRAKPVGFVSYGGRSGGLRAVEQLRAVFAELHTVTVRETVSFHGARGNFHDGGEPRDTEAANAAAAGLIAQLAWWADALREARTSRPYPG